MPALTLSTRQRRLLGYWWAPLVLLAVVLTVIAWLHPYQQLELSDLPEPVLAGAGKLDRSFGKPVDHSFRYALRRTFSAKSGPVEVEIRVTLQPLGGGLVQRQDDWFELGGHSVVYQERYILYRNLFAVHTRSREVAPLVHDLIGRIGWYNDSVETLAGTAQGQSPAAPDWKLDLTMDRLSDTDGKGLTLETTRYQRRQHCEASGQLDGAAIGAGFKGSYARISCRTSASNQPAERLSDYVWLPEPGIFLLLGYRQQTDNTDGAEKLDASGRYLSFETLP
jgi:hypothetical protein